MFAVRLIEFTLGRCGHLAAVINTTWLRCRGVEIERGARVRAGAVIERQGGRVSLGADTVIHGGARLLAAGGSITIGRRCSVNPGCVLYGHGGLAIGDDVRLAAHAVIVPANHVFDDPVREIRLQGETRRGVSIGRDVWIGASVVVLDGVTLADGTVVGAGAIVTKSTEPGGVYVGNPARLLRYRGQPRGRSGGGAT